MTARDRITKHAEAAGWTVTAIEWEPLGLGAEMEGPSGGWTVWMHRDGAVGEYAGGYNWQQVVAWIDAIDGKVPWGDIFTCPTEGCISGRGHRADHWMKGDPRPASGDRS